MKKFTMGAIAGASALALSIPIVLQFASAASSDGSISFFVNGAQQRPVPSQACVQALASQDDSFLKNIDAMIATHKTAMQAHKDALVAAAQIADDTQRVAALKKANEDFRTAMKAAMDAKKIDHQADIDALKTVCGDSFGPHGMMMHGPGGPGMGMMMGKPFGGKGHHMRGPGPDDDGDDQPTQQ